MSTDDSASSDHPRSVLDRHGLRASPSRGQNFLLWGSALDRIVRTAELRPADAVLEVGAGLGRLTRRLADRACRVVGVEVDSGLFDIARRRLEGRRNVRLLHCDFLESKHRIDPAVTGAVRKAGEECPGDLKVVSNLPYCIASPALVCLLEWELPVAGAFVLLQSDVADRLTAGPGSGDYGPLTVLVRYWASVEKAFDLPPHAFWPQPRVSSTFVKVLPDGSGGRAADYECFRKAVAKLFQLRRKTLRKGLKVWLGNRAADRLLQETGLPPSGRPETLEPGGFVALADALARLREG